jgi:hypothetical protein
VAAVIEELLAVVELAADGEVAGVILLVRLKDVGAPTRGRVGARYQGGPRDGGGGEKSEKGCCCELVHCELVRRVKT